MNTQFFIFFYFFLFNYMLNGQNQIIKRLPIYHCKRGVLNCTKCQEAFRFNYMLINFAVKDNQVAMPMIEHEGVLKTYEIKKIFDSFEEAQNYANEQNIPIEISMLDKDSVLIQLSKKVHELEWHIDFHKDKVRIFSVYPVQEVDTGKFLLPEIIYTLRPLNSKIDYAYFYTQFFKVINHEYIGLNSKMNPVHDHPKEYAVEKVREIEKFVLKLK